MNDKHASLYRPLLGIAFALAVSNVAAQVPEPSAHPVPPAEASGAQHEHRKHKGLAPPTDDQAHRPAPAEHPHDHRDQKGMASGDGGTMTPEDGGDVDGHDHRKVHK